MTYSQLNNLSKEVNLGKTLLVCCKAFNAEEDAFSNLTLKKIPQSILSKCEWGKDDYSLNVENYTNQEDEIDTVGGMVYSKINRIPKNNEVIDIDKKIKIKIIKSNDRKIEIVEITNLNN